MMMRKTLAIFLLMLLFGAPAVAQAPLFDATELPDGEYLIQVKDGKITNVKRPRPIIQLKVEGEEEDPTDPNPTPGGLQAQVSKWLEDVPQYDGREDHVLLFSAGFEGLYKGLDAGDLDRAEAVTKERLVINTMRDMPQWEPFANKLKSELKKMQQAGELTSVGQLADAYENIYKGFPANRNRSINLSTLLEIVVRLVSDRPDNLSDWLDFIRFVLSVR